VVAPLTSDDARTIGPYQLLGQLGHGGLGQVFLGCSASGDAVAVKVIRPELAGDPWFRDQFRTEVAAARKVGGAFVTPVVDADLDGDVPWLATAYVDGPTLADAIRERGPVPAPALLMLASGLAEGLAAIHAAGVVHGNLHPSNVLLAEDGPRVADFGIARAAVASGLPGADYGSPGFLSPEQALGDDAGPPSDIFSFGALLTFACTGHGPFGSGTSAALMYRLVNSPADLGDLPGELRSLVGSCLAKQPGNRPAAGRLLEEFGALGSRGDGRPGPMVAAARAEPTALALAGASATAGASGGEPWLGGGSRRSRRRESRRSAAGWIAGGLLAASAAIIVVMTGAVPLSSAGQSQFHGGAAPAGLAPTSQPPNSGSPPSASAGSSPSASRTGHSGGIAPSVQEGPSASAFPGGLAQPPVAPSSPAAILAAPRTSASASASPSKSASPSSSPSPSASPSSSPSPSPSPSPSSSAPSSPPPSSSAPSSASPSSSATSSVAPSSTPTASP
jgi:serine/threonine protein kinase